MGMQGYVVVCPTGQPTPGNGPILDYLAQVVDTVLGELERAAMLKPGTAASAGYDQDGTGVCPGPEEGIWPAELVRMHASVGPEQMTPRIGELVYTATEADWEFPNARDGVLAAPYLDVTALSEPVDLIDGVSGENMGRSWLIIEFSFSDARLSDEIHMFRGDGHPVVARLARALGSELTSLILT